MAYDEQLAARVRVLLKGQRALVDKKMFGGLAYMSQGKMFAGVLKDNLAVRVGPDGTKRAAQLQPWLARGLEFISGLPVAKRRVRRQRG
jgi:TfoX/Sxy family transcriptional regulator of competence genes